MFTPRKFRRQSRKRIILSLILDCFIINNTTFHARIGFSSIEIRNNRADGDMTFRKGKRRKPFDMFFFDLLRNIFFFFLLRRRVSQFQPFFTTAENCYRFQNRISLLGSHCIKLTYTHFPTHNLFGTKIRIKLIDHRMQFFIRQSFIYCVCGIYPKRKRNTFAVIELFQPIFYIVRVTYFHILLKRWICQNINISLR